MNDILLSPEARQKAKEDWYTDNCDHIEGMNAGELRAGEDNAICRAQVQKVCKWLESDCTEHDPPAYVISKPMIRVECPECWQVLRAVAGLRREETHGIRQGDS